jgi:uncharacterized protein (TIGR00156 family)
MMKLRDKMIIAAAGVFMAAGALFACGSCYYYGGYNHQWDARYHHQGSRGFAPGGFIGPQSRALGGGFTGPSADVVAVAKAKQLGDSAPVIVRGRIVKSLGSEKYTFSDDTGPITIAIDGRVWAGLEVSDKDMIEISGEVSKGPGKVEIDVRTIRKL